MKKSKFSLKQYSLLSVAFLISKEGINEVVFTDIDPDIIMQFDNDVTGIDMDNNGSIDFAFLKTSDTYIYFQSSASSGFPVVRNAIFAGPYRYENKIACPYLSVSGDFFYAPYALEAGDTIDNNLSFSNYGFQEMAWKIAFPDLGGGHGIIGGIGGL